MTERFMVDDAGTLIDMHTRNTYDYVSDVTPLLNELQEENKRLRFGLLCEKLGKAPKEPVMCRCHYEPIKEDKMEDKRFKLTDANYIYDIQDKAIYPTLESIVKHLNEFHERNERIKFLIDEAIRNERTELGKSVLKQLKEAIE